MKDVYRYILYTVIAVLAVLLVQSWQKQYPLPAHVPGQTVQQQQKAITQNVEKQATLGGYVPGAFQKKSSATGTPHPQAGLVSHLASKHPRVGLIWVKTDLFQVGIDSKTGNVVDTQLLKFPVSIQDKQTPITLLNPETNKVYMAQSGLSTSKGPQQIQFSSKQDSYELKPSEKSLQVVLVGKTSRGLQVTKTYDFQRNKYAIPMRVQIKNEGSKAWSGNLYTQLLRQPENSKKGGMFAMHSYTGASLSSPETPYEKLSFKAMQKETLSRTNLGGWVAMQQHYFLSAWVPKSQDKNHHFYSHYTAANGSQSEAFIIGFLSPEINLQPGKTAQTGATLYVGPESLDRLTALAPGLNHTMDYGFLWPISITIQWVMSQIVKVIPNWGVAIILATILIKILFYWFSSKSFLSMARMKELQPRIKALKERFADDKVGLQKATMGLYKEKKVNPLGGCLPMVIQIPVFIALYYVITQSIDFRQAPFAFWIHDLSTPDPYYILPVLMMFTMLLQQWLSPTSADPAQAKMMLIMPILFAFFFRNFPAGLVLYWCVNNLVQALQQWYVMQRYKAGKYNKPDKKRKKHVARR